MLIVFTDTIAVITFTLTATLIQGQRDNDDVICFLCNLDIACFETGPVIGLWWKHQSLKAHFFCSIHCYGIHTGSATRNDHHGRRAQGSQTASNNGANRSSRTRRKDRSPNEGKERNHTQDGALE